MSTLTWSGATGWYAIALGNSSSVQRFDSNGAAVGSAITIDHPVVELVADGSDLLALQVSTSRKISVVRIDATGTESIANEVGGGELEYGHLARLGNELLVAWTRPGHLQVALTAP